MDKTFDERPASKQNLTFAMLEKELQDKLNIKKLLTDILKTLNLYSEQSGYNNAAELIADENNFYGIDIVRFGKNIDEMMERKQFTNQSILIQFQQTLNQYRKYYEYEKVLGSTRQKQQLIPEVAFREAVANALVHRAWDVRANILISLYEDRIEIKSPGGLPFGITEAEYLSGYLSVSRNPLIANLFFRLNYIEMFGTGILRIKQVYVNEIVSPKFKVTPNALVVTLPVLNVADDLSADEWQVLAQFEADKPLSKRQLVAQTNLSASKISRILPNLVEKNLLTKIGAGRATQYHK